MVKYSTLPFSFTFNLISPAFRSMVFHQNKNIFFTSTTDPKDYTKKCIDRAISWIIHQQSLQPDDGMAGYVSFSLGSLKISRSYPETVGYTIITLFDYASLFNSRIAYDSALKMADFEIKIQNSDGSFNGGLVGDKKPSVFNSAQIADGLLKAYTVNNDQKYLTAALSACRWISSVQDDEGSWSRFNFLGMKRVYDTKVSQTLLKADSITNNNEFGNVVEKNLNWVISNQNEKGWFNNCDNTVKHNNSPLTHTIGYTTHGLIECYLVQKDPRWLDAAMKPLTALSDQFQTTKKPLSARYFSDWTAAARSSCITGNSQISLCWFLLYDILKDPRYLTSALELNNFLKSIQFDSPCKEISGAVPSSFPIYGDYHPYTITNWTVKYYTDSLISEYRVRKTL